MSDHLVAGYCDPRFAPVRDQFTEALKSGFDTGASIAVEHQGEMVVNLWGGYKDREKTVEKQVTIQNGAEAGFGIKTS